jgi:hypothetical protein
LPFDGPKKNLPSDYFHFSNFCPLTRKQVEGQIFQRFAL